MDEAFRIEVDGLTSEPVRALVAHHIAEMHANSPACKVHALPAAKLQDDASVTFYSVWQGRALAGIGALKELDALHGELKSMRAAPAFRGKGVGRVLLAHLLEEAGSRGYRRISLETGRAPVFASAIALYLRNGFVPCEAFADYVVDEHSQCFTLHL